MRALNFDSVEWRGHGSHRTTTGVEMKRLFQGDPGPGNFELTVVKPNGDYTTPRHRHTFEQFMYVKDGSWQFGDGEEGIARAGMIGYVPEGAFYGPQRLKDGSFSITLQFGGASGLGFLNYNEWYAATNELTRVGRFEGGKYYRNENGGEGKDAFEAIWEHHHGRKIEYVAPRYSRPFAIKPQNYQWVPVPYGANKHLGTFSERHWALDIHHVESHSEFELGSKQRVLLVILEGDLVYGGDTYPTLSAFDIGESESATFTTASGARLLQVTLPDVSEFRAGRATPGSPRSDQA